MGVHSTLNVSREAALETLKKTILDDNISDEMVSRLLNAFLYPHLYNAMLVTDGKGSDDNTVLDLI